MTLSHKEKMGVQGKEKAPENFEFTGALLAWRARHDSNVRPFGS